MESLSPGMLHVQLYHIVIMCALQVVNSGMTQGHLKN